jgi:uncharacterized protein (TIGR02246 family)
MKLQVAKSEQEAMILDLYHALLDSWNRRDARGFAALYAENGSTVGFDGSQMNGRAQIEDELSQIFAGHKTGTFVSKVREVRFLSPEAALLRAVVGMVPDGESDIKSDVNAVQSLVAVRHDNEWKIALSQMTPAQFHGRPELAEALIEELRELL